MKFFTTLCLLAISIRLISQPTGWSYVQPISVTENTGTLTANYQLKLTVNTQALITAGKMNSDGSDIRFGKNCAGTTLFNYWIESGINTPSTIIWVKIDTLQANATSKIYLFYGNTTATSVSAVNGTFVGPISSTDSVSSGGAGGVGDSQRGFRFQPNEDILVTSFGKREPTGTTRYVTLFDNTSQAVITQTTVSGPAAQYSYANISNPIWLMSGTQYVLQLFQATSDGYYFGTSSQINSRITYLDMRYCNSCNQNTFPTNTLSNYHYGTPDFLFYAKNNVAIIPSYTLQSEYSSMSFSAVSSASTICIGNSSNLTASGANEYLWNTGAITSSISVTPTATTVYSVTGSYFGCASVTSTLSVNVNNLPNITASTTNTQVCLGQTATLVGNGGTSYVWNTAATTSSISVTPTVAVSYTVIGTDNNNCSNTATISLDVLTQVPVVSAVSSSTLICAGETATLTASGATTYSWSSAQTTSVITVNPSNTTIYTVNGSLANGCANAYSLTVNVSPCTAIASLNGTDNSKIVIYPNPSNGLYFIEIENATNIVIYDVLGNVVLKENLKAGKHQMDLTQQANGIYMMSVLLNGTMQQYKLIKQ